MTERGDRNQEGSGDAVAAAGARPGGPGAAEQPLGASTDTGAEAFSRMEVRTGVFVLAAAAILGFFYFFGKDLRMWVEPHRNLVVTFEDISGLEDGASVRYAGMTVGKVTWIRIVYGEAHKIEVGLRVRADVPLREGTVASIRATELVIGKYVDLSGGRADAPLLPDGAEVPGGQEPTLDEVINSAGRIILNLRDIVDQVNSLFKAPGTETLMSNLNRMTKLAAGDDRSILVNLRETMQKISDSRVVEQWVDITQTVSENKDRIVNLVEQANRLAIDSNRMLLAHERQISSLLNDLGSLAGAFSGDAVPLAGNLRTLAANAASGSADLPELIRETKALMGKVDTSLTALNKILARTENLDGSDIREFFQHEGIRIYFTERQAPKRDPKPGEPAGGR